VRRPDWRWLRRRPALAGLAGLLLLNLAFAAGFTLPRSVAERTLEERIAALKKEVDARGAELAKSRERRRMLSDNGRDAHRLMSRLVTAREENLVPILEEIESAAREFGLSLGARSLVPEPLEDVEVTRLQINLPVEGSYTALVGFLRRLEHSPHLITVDELKLSQREGSAQRATALDMRLSLYFHSTASERAKATRAR
jgi:Tfp pilus assembly protein PilO